LPLLPLSDSTPIASKSFRVTASSVSESSVFRLSSVVSMPVKMPSGISADACVE